MLDLLADTHSTSLPEKESMVEPLQPFTVEARPDEVRQRLRWALDEIGSVWFPTRHELQVWEQSTKPLYIRWYDTEGFEIGPHTISMRSACFCPVLRGRLVADDTGCRLDWKVALPRFTVGLLGGWGLIAVVWAGWLIPRLFTGEAHVSWLLWWAIPVVGALTALYVGHINGHAALLTAGPYLRQVARNPVPHGEQQTDDTEHTDPTS